MNVDDFKTWCASLDPDTFERFVRDLLVDERWEARCTPHARDGGFDIFLASRTDNRRRLVEVKKRETSNVGRVPVQKLAGVGCEHGVAVLLLVTNSSFADTATKTARRINAHTVLRLHLMDGDELYARALANGNYSTIRQYVRATDP